jgi:hypothetical protein
MGGIRHGIGSIRPFARHTQSAASCDRQTQEVTVFPLLGFEDGMSLSPKGLEGMGDLNAVRQLVELQCS